MNIANLNESKIIKEMKYLSIIKNPRLRTRCNKTFFYS